MCVCACVHVCNIHLQHQINNPNIEGEGALSNRGKDINSCTHLGICEKPLPISPTLYGWYDIAHKQEPIGHQSMYELMTLKQSFVIRCSGSSLEMKRREQWDIASGYLGWWIGGSREGGAPNAWHGCYTLGLAAWV